MYCMLHDTKLNKVTGECTVCKFDYSHLEIEGTEWVLEIEGSFIRAKVTKVDLDEQCYNLEDRHGNKYSKAFERSKPFSENLGVSV